MHPKKPRKLSAAERTQAAMRELEKFKAGFRKSTNGNPTCEWEGGQLTIFERYDTYAWSICDLSDGTTRYSEQKYEDCEEAMIALAKELLVVDLECDDEP